MGAEIITLPLREMILDIVHYAGIRELEFAVYDPLKDDPYDKPPRKLFRSHVSYLRDTPLNEISEVECQGNDVIGLSSRVRAYDRELHIPQVDFCCARSDASLRRILKLLVRIEQTDGFVLDSGRSYHFYGRNLLDGEKWESFMERLSLFGDLVEMWPTNCMNRLTPDREYAGYSVLRLSTCPIKPMEPRVILKIGEHERPPAIEQLSLGS